ncbi:MAG: 50S ribosomal protein L10 [Schleiferiaceae bacterium]|nr:50S ribosomal protein L10 [Schleiferiaceae bacterium]
MTREEKNNIIEELTAVLEDSSTVYVTDISGLDADATSRLRRLCFNSGIQLSVVKNTLLKQAMERSSRNFDGLYPILKGSSSIMIAEAGNAPAKMIKEFRKKSNRPLIKGAYIDEAFFIGDEQLDALATLKSKNELIGDVIALLQSPAKNVISALKSSGNTIAGLLKTLEEREN